MKNFSRGLLSCLLAVAVLLSLAIPASAAFSDVSSGSWYVDEVEYCRENGLMSGTSATEFSPNTPMTRDMLITVRGAGYRFEPENIPLPRPAGTS